MIAATARPPAGMAILPSFNAETRVVSPLSKPSRSLNHWRIRLLDYFRGCRNSTATGNWCGRCGAEHVQESSYRPWMVNPQMPRPLGQWRCCFEQKETHAKTSRRQDSPLKDHRHLLRSSLHPRSAAVCLALPALIGFHTNTPGKRRKRRILTISTPRMKGGVSLRSLRCLLFNSGGTLHRDRTQSDRASGGHLTDQHPGSSTAIVMGAPTGVLKRTTIITALSWLVTTAR
jgi:hypothetical protein